MSDTKQLLITGATGKQGKKLIDILLASPSSKDSFNILAVTRNPDSASAKALAAKSPIVKLVKGNLNDVPAIFKSALEASNGAAIWGVFGVIQAVVDGANQETETRQGKALVDGAVANNVKVFVYSSVDRGGDNPQPTYVPHFISKHEIEAHLTEKCKDGKMQYTILRPVAFFEGLTPDYMGKIFATAFKTSLKPGKRLSFVATSDIGFFGAQAFLQPANSNYKNQAISLAGDDLTFVAFNNIFHQKMGYDVPTTFGFVAWLVKWLVKELGIMFRWFDEEGFEIDIAKCQRLHPGMMTFGDWLDKESGFVKK